jgi:hypothetical protein
VLENPRRAAIPSTRAESGRDAVEYVFKLEQRAGYLHAKVSGNNDAATVMRYLKDVYDACLREECPRVLIEESLEGPGLSVAEVFGVIAKASEQVWPVVQQIAYVDTNPLHDFAKMQFAEVVASNRGVNVRVFSSIRYAKEWLSSASDGRAGHL